MPPSPLLRASPGRERGKEAHKRGRSLEHSLSYKSKDDDLLLFADIQNGEKEKESFLLQSSDDFDESLNNLRYFSEFKPIKIPTKGESSDLLNAEGDKNDYDWLLTPPDTPLFPSLDDEPPPLKVITRGRPQSQTKSLSRSSTMERTQRSSRSSASPSRHSPSPRSTVSTVHSLPRQSSASRGSSPSMVRTSTPTRRPSTPPAKTSTPSRRSASPTPRRISTGSFSQPKRGISPVKNSRGTSPSPKIHRWDTNPPGFPTETPPNLRTSLPDRPASRSRGVSPVSGIGSDSSSKYRRQSMSPTPSRSASSSHSHDRDRFSSHSTADDDMDSMSSFSNNISAKKSIGMVKNRTVAVSKKPAKNIVSVGSAPKRSFDSALWLMDHRKAPQNMFRPLLSSVPTSSFVTGKSSNTNRPMFSRNSSVTTSSNASSEHGATVAPYLDSDHDHMEYPDGESERIEGSEVHDEMFAFDKVDELNENLNHDEEIREYSRVDFHRELVEVTCSRCRKCFFIVENDADIDLCEECVAANKIALLQPAVVRDEMTQTEISMKIEDDFHEKSENENVQGKECSMLLTESAPRETREESNMEISMKIEHDLQEKASSDNIPQGKECSMLLSNFVSREIGEESNVLIVDDAVDHGLLERQKQIEILRKQVVPDLNTDEQSETKAPEVDASGSSAQKEPSANLEVKDLSTQQASTYAKDERQLLPHPNLADHNEECAISDLSSHNKQHQIQPAINPVHRSENTEGTGISVLLMQRSSSNKWPVVDGRSISSMNIHCSEPSYTRANSSVLKRSFGHQSSSASSSVDLGPFRNTEARLHQLLSNRKKASGRHASSMSTGSVSDMSISGSSVHIGSRSDNNEEFCNSFDEEDNKASETTSPSVSERNAVGLQNRKVEGLQNISTEHGATDVLEASIDEYDDKIMDLQNDAESERAEHTETDPSEESHISTVSKKEELVTPVDSCIVEVSSKNHEELSSAKTEAPKQLMQRSFTLEEATDTILFCSSIVHDIAYKAAGIAIEKENSNQEVLEEPRATVNATNYPSAKLDNSTGPPAKRIVNARKIKRKRHDTENTPPTGEAEGGDVKDCDSLPATGDTVHKEGLKPLQQQPPPAKLEAKCNCTIM